MYHEQQPITFRQSVHSQRVGNSLLVGLPQNELNSGGTPLPRSGDLNARFSPVMMPVPPTYCLRNGTSTIFSTVGTEGEPFISVLNMPPNMSSTGSLDRNAGLGHVHSLDKGSPQQHVSYSPHMQSFTHQGNGESNRRRENSLLAISTPDSSDHGNDVATVKVFDTDFQNLLTIPLDAVRQFPPPKKNITRWVLCRNYLEGLREREATENFYNQPFEPDPNSFGTGSSGCCTGLVTGCAMGSRCNFVHVDMDKYRSQIVAHPVHINYVWANPEDCGYPRLPPGITVRVFERLFSSGNGASMKKESTYSSEPIEVNSNCIIYTAAFARNENDENTGSGNGSIIDSCANRVFRQCEQFHGYSFCPLADECTDVHVMHIDPSKDSADHKWVRPKLKPRKRQGGGCGPSTPLSGSISGVSSFFLPSLFMQGDDNARRGQEQEVAGPLMSRGSDAPPVIPSSHSHAFVLGPSGNPIPVSENQPAMREGTRVVQMNDPPYSVTREQRPMPFTSAVSSPGVMGSRPTPTSLATSFSTSVPPLEGGNCNLLGSYCDLYNRLYQAIHSQAGSSGASGRDMQIPQLGSLPHLNASQLGGVSSVPMSYTSSSPSISDSRHASGVPPTFFSSASPRVPESQHLGQNFNFFKKAGDTENESKIDRPAQTHRDEEDDEMIKLLTDARMKYDIDSEYDDE